MDAERGFTMGRAGGLAGERIDAVHPGQGDDAGRTRRIAILVVAALIAVAVIYGAYKLFAGSGEAPAAADSTPRVTVIVPGRQAVTAEISATGTLAAKRDMPIGVSGEGGLVTRVLVEPGQWVKTGQTLAVIDRRVQAQQAEQLSAQINVARADAALAEAELKRAQALVDRGFISRADVDRRVATRDAALARVKVAQAQYGEVREQIGRLDVVAPTDGLILTRAVEVGQLVGAQSTALFRIAERGEMEMQARLAETDLAAMRVGLPAQVTPVGLSKSFPGSIWQLSPIIDPDTRQGVVRIQLAYDPALRPGGFAGVTITSGAAQAPLLPESAVQSDAKGNYVYVVNRQNQIERRDVRVGQVTDKGIAVLNGISGNEQVVYSAGAFLNPGDKVIPTRQAAAR